MDYFRLFRIGIKKTIWFTIDSIIKLFPIYYTSINRLPIYYWFELQKGDYSILYKVKFIKHIPYFFYNISMDMLFEFDNLDLTLLRKKADLAVLNSIATRTNDKSIKFQADVLKKEIERKISQTGKDISLNEFIDYIEMTFNNIGQLDVYKLSTSRAFSLYNKAIERNKRLNNVHNSK